MEVLEQGYEATSVDDLCVPPASRSSLYPRSEPAKPVAAVGRSLRRVTDPRIAAAGAAIVDSTLRHSPGNSSTRSSPVPVSAAAFSGIAPRAAAQHRALARIRRGLGSTEAIFRDALLAPARELASSANVEALARFLTAGFRACAWSAR